MKEKSLQKKRGSLNAKASWKEGLEYNCMIEKYCAHTLNLWAWLIVKRELDFLVILNFRVTHSPVQLCVVKEKSSQKRGAHWMPRHHEKKDRNAILRLKHICRPLKSYCIWVATKFFVYKFYCELSLWCKSKKMLTHSCFSKNFKISKSHTVS